MPSRLPFLVLEGSRQDLDSILRPAQKDPVWKLLYREKSYQLLTNFPHTNFDLQYNFHINIFRRHREIAFVKLLIKTDTW